jgi:hypothetical protein
MECDCRDPMLGTLIAVPAVISTWPDRDGPVMACEQSGGQPVEATKLTEAASKAMG